MHARTLRNFSAWWQLAHQQHVHRRLADALGGDDPDPQQVVARPVRAHHQQRRALVAHRFQQLVEGVALQHGNVRLEIRSKRAPDKLAQALLRLGHHRRRVDIDPLDQSI